MATEQQISIANKLYESRRTLRRLLGDGYAAEIVKWMKIVEERTTAEMPVLQTGMRIVEVLTEGGHDGFPIMWTLAAIVELIEPDEQTPAWEMDGPKA